MFEEKVLVAPTPLLRAITNAGASNSILTSPKKLLGILSRRDVVFYYVANTMVCDLESLPTDTPLVTALRDLARHTTGIMNVFTKPEWVEFSDEFAADIRAERLSGRNVYEYLTGEGYDKDGLAAGIATVYETKTTVVDNGTVVIMIVPDIDNDAVYSNPSCKLFGQVARAMHTVTSDIDNYKSIYVGYCGFVFQNTLALRAAQ